MNKMDETTEKVALPLSAVEKLQAAFDQASYQLTQQLKGAVDAVRTGAVPIPEEQPSENHDSVGVGELRALHERLKRVDKQLRELHPLPADGKRHPKAESAAAKQPETSATALAAVRTLLDAIEDRLADVLPHRSSGKLKHNFHGRKRVSRFDGQAIRSDFQRLGREATYMKWCFDGKRGYPGGQGEYTRQQVATTLAHDAGGHRRRRRNALAKALAGDTPSNATA